MPVDIHSFTDDRVLHAFGEEVRLYLTDAETGGQFAQWLEITPPGSGPPPHYYTNEDEWFYVLYGTVSFSRDGAWQEVGLGARCIAQGAASTRLKIPTALRMLLTTSPSGFELFFARCAEEFAKPGGPDMPRIIEIAAEHGIHFVEA